MQEYRNGIRRRAKVENKGTELGGERIMWKRIRGGNTFKGIFRVNSCFLYCKTASYTPRKGNMNDLLPLTKIF